MKMMRKVVTAVAAAALVIATVPTVPTYAATEIVKYDFENGTGMTSTGLGTDPQVVSDAERGNVLQFADGASSQYVSTGVEGSDETLGIANTRIDSGSPSSLSFANPYCGKSLSGATIAMWVKVPAGASETAPGLVGFVSENVSRPHPDQVSFPDSPEKQKLQASTGPYAFGITASSSTTMDIEQYPMLNMAGLQHNWYTFFDNDMTFAANEGKWVHMIVSVQNGIEETFVYMNGQKVSCEQAGGKRYNKGELDAGENGCNTTEPTMLEILSMAEMKNAYVGYTGFSPTVSGVCIDDLTFYDGAITDAEAQEIYAAAQTSGGNNGGGSTPTDGSGTDANGTNADGSSTTGGSTNSSNSSSSNSSSSKSSSGTSSQNNSNLPQTGVVSTGLLVAGGAAAVAAGAILFKKKEKDEQ